MSSPTVGDRRALKRLARYLAGAPRLVSKFDTQYRPEEVFGFSDSDWAGCRKTSRSSSGGAMLVGSHCIKTWSATQKSITLSSGEAELVAAVKMSCELIGLCQLAKDWGQDFKAKVWVDSSAAIGVVHRKGCGKLRHVRVGMLWIQERAESGDLVVAKVLGTDNPADLMTKHLGTKLMDAHIRRLQQEVKSGRADTGLKA